MTTANQLITGLLNTLDAIQYPKMKTTSKTFAMPALVGDVGYNLPASERFELWPGEYAQVHCNVRVEMPPGVWGLILPRSSANRTGKLVVLPGVIDGGYRGELTVMVHNIDQRRWFRKSKPVVIEVGHSLAQLVLFPIITPQLEVVESLSDTVRGERGYGSTGKTAI